MLIRISTYLALFMCCIVVYALFAIKAQVGALSYQLKQIDSQIIDEQNTINILKAELAYLSSPSMLKILAGNHLKLANIKTSQMIKDPLAEESNKKVADEKTVTKNYNTALGKRNVKWRYKRATNKYVQQVSSK